MNDGFKQRLVGAIVLGSLVLILWPIVFSKATGPIMDRRSQIPEPPLFEKYTVPEPVHPSNIDPIVEYPVDEGSLVEKPLVENDNANNSDTGELKSPVSKKSQAVVDVDSPKLDKKGLPESWVLQVASFEKDNNAKELKKKLQKKGYKAYTRRVKTSTGESVRVYVGPKLTKSAFAEDKKAIDKAFKLQSLVVRFRQ